VQARVRVPQQARKQVQPVQPVRLVQVQPVQVQPVQWPVASPLAVSPSARPPLS